MKFRDWKRDKIQQELKENFGFTNHEKESMDGLKITIYKDPKRTNPQILKILSETEG